MPDIVRLTNGGMVRGTIVEETPDGAVTILLVTGESRTFPRNEIAYAGTAEGAPSMAKPETQARAPEPRIAPTVETQARVRFDSSRDDLTVHRRTGTVYAEGSWGSGWTSLEGNAYARLCTAPCDAQLPPGDHRLAVSKSSSSRVAEAPDEVRVNDGDTLRVDYRSKGLQRGIGYALMPVSILGGLSLIAVSVLAWRTEECTAGTCFDKPDFKFPLMVAGMIVMPAGFVTGMLLARSKDSARFELVPSSGAAGLPRSLGGGLAPTERGAAAVVPTGASLRVTF